MAKKKQPVKSRPTTRRKLNVQQHTLKSGNILNSYVAAIERNRQLEAMDVLSTSIKLSQQTALQIAKKAKVSPTTVQHVRTKTHIPNKRVIASIANVLRQEFAKL